MVDALRTARLGSGSSSPSFEGDQNRRALLTRQAVGIEDLEHLAALVVRLLDDFSLFASPLAGVVFGIAARREISTESHRDRTGGDLGQTGDYDHTRGSHGGKPGRQGEGYRQAVGHADDNIAHGSGRSKMSFYVG